MVPSNCKILCRQEHTRRFCGRKPGASVAFFSSRGLSLGTWVTTLGTGISNNWTCLIENCSCWWDGYDGKTKMREVKQSCHTVNKTDLLQPLLPPSVASPLILCMSLDHPKLLSTFWPFINSCIKNLLCPYHIPRTVIGAGNITWTKDRQSLCPTELVF